MTTTTAEHPFTATRNVEDVLRESGPSRFHKKAILVTGAAWTFVAMEILLVGFVAPIFAGLWNLDGRMQGLVNSAALAGSLCGSLLLRRTADRIGGRGGVVGRAFPLPAPGWARGDPGGHPGGCGRIPPAGGAGAAGCLPRLLGA